MSQAGSISHTMFSKSDPLELRWREKIMLAACPYNLN